MLYSTVGTVEHVDLALSEDPIHSGGLFADAAHTCGQDRSLRVGSKHMWSIKTFRRKRRYDTVYAICSVRVCVPFRPYIGLGGGVRRNRT